MREEKLRVSGFYRPGWSAAPSLERPSPLLLLVGSWLAEAGFAPGDEVRVTGRDGRLQVVRRELDDSTTAWDGR
jgi:hypothetical protein